MARKGPFHINLFIQSRGHHEASWRHPGASTLPLTDFNYYLEATRKAQTGLFDSVFFADTLGVGEFLGNSAHTWLEPIAVLSALAATTETIGLIATASTTYTEPYNLARQFCSIDHISRGRAGWNIVTSWSTAAAGNFGGGAQVSHADRYERAEEYVRVTKALWDSWDDDAILDDRDGGLYAQPSKVRAINHVGEHYQVAGPLNIPRSPQGRPVLVQAGSSEAGRDFAARHAEAIFTAHLEKATAQAFYRDLKERTHRFGRNPEHAVILPGFSPVIAGTEEEAHRLTREMNELADPELGRQRLSGRFGGHDFSHLPMDRPLTVDDFPDPATVQAARSRTEIIVNKVRNESPTLRQLLATLAGARGHFTFAGTPEQTADVLQSWYEDGAADGFNLMPPVIPEMLDAFVDAVVPILQRRGLFRTAYEAETLRGHYGLPRP